MKKVYKLTKAEQETIIRWDPEKMVAYIDTAYLPMIAKLDKLVEAFPKAYKCVFVDPKFKAKKYTVAASFIKFGKPPSEAKKAAGRDRARKLFRRNAQPVHSSP